MAIKRIFYFLAILGIPGMAFSLPVDGKTVDGRAQAFWRQMGGKAASELTDISGQLNFNHLRVYAAQGGGWVVMSADDVARPVLAYSTNTAFPVEGMPVQMERWLAGYDSEIGRAVELGYPPDAEWQRGGASKSGGYEAVGPLLSTQWDQGDPFNAYCPGHCPVGCAATMQAQIMKYWNFPAFGQGNHRYNSQSYGPQAADFGHTMYEWELMPNIGRYSATAAERHALSTLLYQIGVSLNMNYSPSGSGAQGFAGWSGAISNDNSLINYFFYKNSLEVKDRMNYSDDDFRNLMIEELSHRRPIAVQGNDLNVGGHAFVCDGNDTLGYLHFNFGWTGTGDGYYAIGAINPGIGSQGQIGDYRFNNDNKIIIKIEPDYAMRVSDTVLSFETSGGIDSLIFCINDTVDQPWSVSVDQPWIAVSDTDFVRAGWVKFACGENTTGSERVATAHFVQGSCSIDVRLVQIYIDSSNICPVTVLMESTRGNGWQGGAYLSLESATGYVYGTATLASGSSGSATIQVPGEELVAVWHSGGGTDRNINYRIENQYGETMLNVEYAYANGGTHHLGNPCGHVAIGDVADLAADIYPNPTSGIVNIGSDIQRAELYSVDGRLLETFANGGRIDLGAHPNGVYLLRLVGDNASTVRRVVLKKR